MIDDSDADGMLVASMLTGGPLGWAFLALAITFCVYSCMNKDECSKMHCPNGQSPTLQNHECQCITKAIP